MTGAATLSRQVAELQAVLDSVLEHRELLGTIANQVERVFRAGNKVLTCGNGGSAAQAMHLVAELVGRYKSDRRAFPAIYLGGGAPLSTCIANDYANDEIFARPLASLAQSGDLLVCFTTSGNSPNIIRALSTANSLGLHSLALLGGGGGRAKGLATFEVVVPSSDTARIQEAHLFLLHWLCEQLDASEI